MKLGLETADGRELISNHHFFCTIMLHLLYKIQSYLRKVYFSTLNASAIRSAQGRKSETAEQYFHWNILPIQIVLKVHHMLWTQIIMSIFYIQRALLENMVGTLVCCVWRILQTHLTLTNGVPLFFHYREWVLLEKRCKHFENFMNIPKSDKSEVFFGENLEGGMIEYAMHGGYYRWPMDSLCFTIT